MVRKYFFLASVAFGLTAVAAQKEVAKYPDVVRHSAPVLKASDFIQPVRMHLNDGSVAPAPAKAASTAVEWKRPAGQFWGTGYSPDINKMGFYFTPLALRPWVEYTFENISTATGTGNWTVQNWSNEQKDWVTSTSREESVTASYLRYERADAPRLGYRGQVIYPTQFYGEKTTYEEGKVGYIPVNPDYEIRLNTEYGDNCNMAVSSHYWGLFSRNETEKSGMTRYVGAEMYEGMEDPFEDGRGGNWFGTNASGYNAMATRMEKPDSPYLLNAVYWYYWFGTDIPKDIPLKAYVFKTVNDAAVVNVTDSVGEVVRSYETLEIGELIATAESYVPAAVYSEDGDWYNSVKFEFKQKNPVTGAENAYSLEIEDDITIVVTGFDVDLGNGGWISSTISLDEFDEGYGNLGFLGRLEESEDGTIDYSMTALKNFFQSPLPNTVLGVLADVSYPWIVPGTADFTYPSEVRLPNEGETTETQQGLQVGLGFLSSAMTEDYEITYNGEDECDWFELVSLDDETEINEDGEEEFSGFVVFDFEAAPNPTDENRTVTVKFSIPAASYEITFLQGSNNNAVEIVGVDGKAEYFDLQGRRVANPEKGLYIRKAGNKAEKVIL